MGSVHGVVLSLLAGISFLVAGFLAGVPLGDQRGVIGYTLGVLALAGGLTWTFGI